MTDDAGSTTDEAPTPRRRTRLIVAGIAAVVVAGLAVTAIAVVPGMIADRQAQDAADAFAAERADWETAFSEDALAPYADLASMEYREYLNALSEMRRDTAFAWRATSTVGDATAVAEACTALAARADGLSSFEDAGVPRLAEVDGGERNADYAAARELYEQERARYEASDEFVERARAAFADLDQVCDYTVAENANARDIADAQNAYLDAYTYEPGTRVHIGTDERPDSIVDTYLVCEADEGCVPWDDMGARATAGERFDKALDARHLGFVEVVEEFCPDALREACAVVSESEPKVHAAGLGVGEAYRTEDPVAVALAGSGDDPVMPQLDAAYDAYNTAWGEQFGIMSDAIEELTGALSLREALDDLATDAAERIEAAARAVSDAA